MRCGICNRQLKNTTSMRRGIGPKCYKNLLSQLESGAHGLDVKLDSLRSKAAKRRWKNERKIPLGPGEVRCENCYKPVTKPEEGDGCPGAYCCSPCCPFAAQKPCPREEQRAQPKDAPGVELVDKEQATNEGSQTPSVKQATITQWGP